MKTALSPAIRYVGAPEMTDGGLEVMSIHLHRFLVGWLDQSPVDRIWITLGFEGSLCESVTFCVELHTSRVVEVGWTFEDLAHTYRRGDGMLHMEGPQGAVTLATTPILDRPAFGGQACVTLGFAVTPEGAALGDALTASLQAHAFEAIAAARRNSMRLFFDESRALDMKSMLYTFMEHLPEWVGCDYAATMILTSSLETMTLEDAPSSRFNILADRAYARDELRAPERLVGMAISGDDEAGNLLAAAFERQRLDADLPYQLFVREDGEGGELRWRSLDTDELHAPFHRLRQRGGEAMIALVPLVARDEMETELLGFLALTWRQVVTLSSSAGQLLAECSDNLAAALRNSSLYSLSARKLWILRRMRRATERLVARCSDERDAFDAASELVREVSDLIASHVEIPSFAIAYMELEHGEEGITRYLRYPHPYGWAHYEQLSLPVDVPDDQRTDSSVASLAVRLNKPLVLAGGYGEGDELSFKNSLFVHEATRRVCDVRSGALSGAAQGEWVALSDYYKPARAQAYATLAYPIAFDGTALGVLAVEVDKNTDWLWWTGFGGHLFWQLVASELASAFYFLGVRGVEVGD